MKSISQTTKIYRIRYEYDILEVKCPVYSSTEYGINEQEAKDTFTKRHPSADILSIEEIKIKNFSSPF